MKTRFTFLMFLFVTLSVFPQKGYFDQIVFNKNEAVILDQEIRYDIKGKKMGFIDYFISKRMKIQLKSQEAVDYFSNYKITKYEDPLYITHSPEARNYTSVYSELKMSYFKATKYTDDHAKELETKAKFEEVNSVFVTDNYYGRYYDISYNITDLKVGDILEIDFMYSIPYEDNFFKLSSNRIFFNTNIFVEKLKLSISHSERLLSEINYENVGKPDTLITIDGNNEYVWSFNNLDANIYEFGSRAYKELPHIVFTIFPYDMFYTLPNSFQEEIIPYYSIYSLIREREFVDLFESSHQGVNNRQFSQMRKFINSELAQLSDTSSDLDKIKRIHNTITNNFTFSNDIDYFKKKDTRNPRMGDYITKKEIRDIKRYDVYAFIFFDLKLNFYSAYVSDNRYSELTESYFKPMAEDDFMFALIIDDQIHFLTPKRSKFGYFIDEIPFYLQNTHARFVHLADYRAHEQPINTATRRVLMANSGINHNQRKTNTLININLETKKMEFNTRINLSGQYSTMTRGVYLYNVKDETVNPLYNEKVWEDLAAVSDTSSKVDIVSQEFPFNANVNASFTSSELIQEKGDILSIDLSNWFKHIIYPGMDVENRTLDFYPDFQGRDTYVYFLKFDKDVKLIKEFEEININNDFGELKINMDQMDSKSIKISSSFAVTAEKIDAENINQVGEIFKSIESLNAQKLRLHLTQ